MGEALGGCRCGSRVQEEGITFPRFRGKRFRKRLNFSLPLPSCGVGNFPWTFVGRLFVFSLP